MRLSTNATDGTLAALEAGTLSQASNTTVATRDTPRLPVVSDMSSPLNSCLNRIHSQRSQPKITSVRHLTTYQSSYQ